VMEHEYRDAQAEIDELRGHIDGLRAEVELLRKTTTLYEAAMSAQNDVIEALSEELNAARADNERLRAELTVCAADYKAVSDAFFPVHDWYSSDEHEPPRLAEMVAAAVADLQEDRADCLRLRAELRRIELDAKPSGYASDNVDKLHRIAEAAGAARRKGTWDDDH
jgi:chromosome segregation ATPase